MSDPKRLIMAIEHKPELPGTWICWMAGFTCEYQLKLGEIFLNNSTSVTAPLVDSFSSPVKAMYDSMSIHRRGLAILTPSEEFKAAMAAWVEAEGMGLEPALKAFYAATQILHEDSRPVRVVMWTVDV